MKQGTTFFLKITVLLLGTPVLVVCGYFLPQLLISASDMRWEYAQLVYPLIIVLYAAAIPFFVALYQAFRLLQCIDHSRAFSEFSVKAIKRIKYSAFAIFALFAGSLPFFFLLAVKDDAPGLLLIGLVITFVSVVIAVFAAVLERLLQEVITMKSENDLTI